jgi:hypothetical protein
MAPIPLGAITGLILSATTSYAITGRLFHPYQRKTPATWRPESWRQHAGAMLLQTIAGAGLGGLYALCGSPGFGATLFEVGIASWVPITAFAVLMALYVNWHPAFVAGIVLDWSVFIGAVLLSCAAFNTPGV